MSELGQINLLVGKNNTGKSSVLEALYLLAMSGEPAALWRVMTRRGAGYAPKNAENTGSQMLRYPQVFELIRQEEDRVLKAIEGSNERVLLEVAAVAFMDPGDLLDEHGYMIDSHLIPSAIRRGFEFTEVYDQNTGQKLPALRRVRLAAKFRALEVLVRHLGLLNEKPGDGDGRFTIEQIRQVLEAWDVRHAEREARHATEALKIEDNSEAIDLEEFRNGGKK